MICDKLHVCAESQFAGRKVINCGNHNVEKCIESSDKRSKVKCEERRKKYILENTKKNHVISYKMDGGIIVVDKTVPAGTCKCDYLLLVDGLEGRAILVELKGVDIPHALKQIRETLLLFPEFFQSFSGVYGRVVATASVPNLKASPDYVNLVRMIRQRFGGGNIKIVEREYLERDVDLMKEA